jgi:hypothetical protein
MAPKVPIAIDPNLAKIKKVEIFPIKLFRINSLRATEITAILGRVVISRTTIKLAPS